MEYKPKGTVLKEDEYIRIKDLLNKGWKKIKAAEISERSIGCINDISHSKDFADYKDQQIKRFAEKKKAQVKTEPIQKGNGIINLVKKQNQELEEIKKILISVDSTLKIAREKGRIKLA